MYQSYCYFLNQRLIAQNKKVADNPNITLTKSNLSSTAGKTTEAKETRPTSEDISESFSNWRLVSREKENSITPRIAQQNNDLPIGKFRGVVFESGRTKIIKLGAL